MKITIDTGARADAAIGSVLGTLEDPTGQAEFSFRVSEIAREEVLKLGFVAIEMDANQARLDAELAWGLRLNDEYPVPRKTEELKIGPGPALILAPPRA